MIGKEKRNLLAKNIPDKSVLVLVGNIEYRRSGDVMYPFRQDSDVLLLSGVSSPNIILVGVKRDAPKMEWMIFSDPLTDKEKLWGTSRLTHEEINTISRIKNIYPLEYIDEVFKKLIPESENILIRTEKERVLPHEKIFLKKHHLSKSHKKFTKIEPYLDALRLIKSKEEIENIQKAIEITHFAYNTIQANIQPGMYEYEIEALIAGVFRSHHLVEAYPTIVASGENACTLHYEQGTRQVQSGDLILVDFGAEYAGYSADITRMFRVGDISPRQQQVYESVVRVKEYAMSQIRPGIRRGAYEKMVRDFMNEELTNLGLIPKNSTQVQIDLLSRKYYPHSTGHFLGLDTHDVGERDELFLAGMVVTCEPGIYIPEEGIGVRLEDDILITEDGCENLSKEIPLGF